MKIDFRKWVATLLQHFKLTSDEEKFDSQNELDNN